MHYLIRLRIFLLCCLIMIGMNVMLIMGGFVTAGSAAGVSGNLSGCDTRDTPDANLMAVPAWSRHLASRCDYGFCAEKR